MSGTRRTEDLQGVKARHIILQNPDGSYAPQGAVIGFADDRGRLGPITDIIADSITTGTLNITTPINWSTVIATNIIADDISVNTVEVYGKLTAVDISTNRIESTDVITQVIHSDFSYTGTATAVHIIAGDISTNTLECLMASITDISAGIITTETLDASVRIRAPIGVIGDLSSNTGWFNTITATDISTNTITAQTVLTGDLTATGLLTADDISANNVYVTNTVSAATMHATTVSASSVSATDVSATNIMASDISATTITVTDVSATNITAASAYFDEAYIGVVQISTYSVNDFTAFNLTATNITTTTLNVTGQTTLFDVAAQNLTAVSITSTDISANTITVTNLTAANISNTQLSTTAITTTDISAINMYTTALETSTLVSTDISSSTLTAPVINMYAATPPYNLGVLTYGDLSGLLINGVPVSNTAALYQEPFSLAPVYNNLATVTDIAATVSALVSSYNSFLSILDSRNIIVQIVPGITINSPLNIQFTLKGVTTAPVQFSIGTYSVEQIIARLNDGGKDASDNQIIAFTATPNPDRNNFSVTIAVSDISGTFIADFNGMPTGSLQMLRYLGFTLPINGTRFENYTLAGASYVMTPLPLIALYISDSTFSGTENFPNNIPSSSPTYTISGDPYSLPITFTDLSTNISLITNIAVSANGSYLLYPKTTPYITIGTLTPNTAYPVLLTYLDNYNSQTKSQILTTTNIPAPTTTTSALAFNRFTLSWPQPYPGKIYKFILTGILGQLSWTPVLGTDVSANGIPGTYVRTSGASPSWGLTPTTSSNCDLSSGGYVSFSGATSITCIVGLTNVLYSSARTGYGFYLDSVTGNAGYIEDTSITPSVFGTYTPTTSFILLYDGTNIRYCVDGVIQRTVTNAIVGALRLDLKFYQVGQSIAKLVVAPLQTSTFSVFSVPQSSTYSTQIYSYETVYNILSAANTVSVTTPALSVPTPTISDISNTNIAKRIAWSPATGADVSGTLNYAVDASNNLYTIPTGASYFDVSGLRSAGDISGSLFYTDNLYNSRTGTSTTFHYDTSFGFYNTAPSSVASSLVIDNVITTGVGYTFPSTTFRAPSNSPWLGYTVNTVAFPRGITEISGNSVVFSVTAYDISGYDISGMYTGPSFNTSIDLSLCTFLASASVAIGANLTITPTLTLSSPVVLTAKTVLMCSISGLGRVRIRSFLTTGQSPTPASYYTARATATLYTIAKTFVNGFNTTGLGSICQFSYV